MGCTSILYCCFCRLFFFRFLPDATLLLYFPSKMWMIYSMTALNLAKNWESCVEVEAQILKNGAHATQDQTRNTPKVVPRAVIAQSHKSSWLKWFTCICLRLEGLEALRSCESPLSRTPRNKVECYPQMNKQTSLYHAENLTSCFATTLAEGTVRWIRSNYDHIQSSWTHSAACLLLHSS